jgi:tetratricopeptide (TPR) repeat protein
MRCVRVAALMLSGSLLVPAHLDAHESSGTAAAKALLAEAEAATKAGKLGEAAAAFRKAIEADPDFAEAHQRFIEITRREPAAADGRLTLPQLRELYLQWAKQQPTRAAYQWGLGFLEQDPGKADVFFNAALKLDPDFARAHVTLARNADLRGDWAAQRRHLEAAVRSNPDNPQYLLRYAQAHRTSEPQRFQELALGVVEKFPDTPAAAEALAHVANESSNPQRRTYFERLRAEYPADKFSYTSLAMGWYYGELTPVEALPVARDMAKWFPTSKTWAQRVAHQEAMVSAQALIDERRFAEAVAVLDKTQKPSGPHGAAWVLLNARAAAGTGQIARAYNALVESVAATPAVLMETALLSYGTELKKTREEIDQDVWKARDAKAAAATPFELASSKDGKPVRLSDYAGRVVLLAFWFPG